MNTTNTLSFKKFYLRTIEIDSYVRTNVFEIVNGITEGIKDRSSRSISPLGRVFERSLIAKFICLAPLLMDTAINAAFRNALGSVQGTVTAPIFFGVYLYNSLAYDSGQLNIRPVIDKSQYIRVMIDHLSKQPEAGQVDWEYQSTLDFLNSNPNTVEIANAIFDPLQRFSGYSDVKCMSLNTFISKVTTTVGILEYFTGENPRLVIGPQNPNMDWTSATLLMRAYISFEIGTTSVRVTEPSPSASYMLFETSSLQNIARSLVQPPNKQGWVRKDNRKPKEQDQNKTKTNEQKQQTNQQKEEVETSTSSNTMQFVNSDSKHNVTIHVYNCNCGSFEDTMRTVLASVANILANEAECNNLHFNELGYLYN